MFHISVIVLLLVNLLDLALHFTRPILEKVVNKDVSIQDVEYGNYPALITDVYDGDTFTAEIYLGFNVGIDKKLRLARVDTPELRGDERERGLEVRDYVRILILNKEVKVVSYGPGKYGREIVEVIVGDSLNLSDHLLIIDKAEPYNTFN